MHSKEAQMIDLVLSQAIDFYRDMRPEDVRRAIALDWPEQLQAMLLDYLFKGTCGAGRKLVEVIEVPREHGDSVYFIPVCSCDLNEWRGL